MIKIVFSEVESPTKLEDAIHLNKTSAVRALNPTSKAATITIVSSGTQTKSITLAGGESVILKKECTDTVFSSTKSIRIAGVSIY